jgi:hypothetical protein
LFAGAAGVKGTSYNASVYHSLANGWSTDGKEDISKFSSLNPINMLNFNDIYEKPELYNIIGLRNTHYILDRDNINLVEELI